MTRGEALSKIALHNSFRLAIERIPSNSTRWGHDVGTCMSILETVILSLVLVWTPGIAFVAYLLMPRPGDQKR